jgi:hypothetical protein
VRAERAKRVLVLPELPEVLAVPVDVEDVPELPRLNKLLQHSHARVVEEEVSGHEDEVALLRQRDELFGLVGDESHRLFDQDVLSGEKGATRELGMRHDRGGEDDGVELVVREQVAEVRRRPYARVPGTELGKPRVARVAEPRELRTRDGAEVSRQVRAPITEPGEPDAHDLTFHRPGKLQRRSAIRSAARPSP